MMPWKPYTSSIVAMIAALVGLGSSACFQDMLPPGTCQPGHEATLNGDTVCVYQSAVVIETGFECPPERPYLHLVAGGVVCTNSPSTLNGVPADLLPIGPLRSGTAGGGQTAGSTAGHDRHTIGDAQTPGTGPDSDDDNIKEEILEHEVPGPPQSPDGP